MTQRTTTYDRYPWSTRAHVSRNYIESPCTALEEHDQSVVKLPWFFFEICDVIMMQKCLLLMLLLTTGWENETCINWVLEFSWSQYWLCGMFAPKTLSGFKFYCVGLTWTCHHRKSRIDVEGDGALASRPRSKVTRWFGWDMGHL